MSGETGNTAPVLSFQHFFTSFGARDRCFLLIFRLWQNALLEKVGMDDAQGGGWGSPERTPKPWETPGSFVDTKPCASVASPRLLSGVGQEFPPLVLKPSP